ncbi:MAG: hypothetical protein K2I36_01230, partial [Ureaplasma sp.]|nr:hypothetical protein [Ureaplasma sp.]
MQLPNTFTTFGSGAFANTTVNQITFGTTEAPIAYTTTSGTSSSDELAAIMKLLKAASQDTEESIGGSSVLQGWTDVNESAKAAADADTTVTPAATKKTKTINGLVWTYDPAANTITCER